MATKGSLSLAGLEKYLEEFAAAGRDVDGAAANALRAGATEVVLPEMIKLVPKDSHNLEEHLEAGEVVRDGNFSSIDVGILDADKETAIYGNVQEFGSSSVEAQPYIRPSFAKKTAIRKAMEKSLKSDGLV